MGGLVTNLIAQLLKVFAHWLYDLIVAHVHPLSGCQVKPVDWPRLRTGHLKLVNESSRSNDYCNEALRRYKWVKAGLSLQFAGLCDHLARLGHPFVNLGL